MARIKLIKGLSYYDGTIDVKKANPVVEVSDADAERYVAAGFFDYTEGVADAVTVEEPPVLDFPEDDEEELTAEDFIKIDLKKMTVKELKQYAEDKGIDIGSASKKDDIIDILLEADRKAVEARKELRQV